MWIKRRTWDALRQEVGELRRRLDWLTAEQRGAADKLDALARERAAAGGTLAADLEALTARVRTLEGSDFAQNRQEYLRTLEQLRASNPGVPMFAD